MPSLRRCVFTHVSLGRPYASKDDRELAFIVLKLGGPSLLDILYRAEVLPSVSTAYIISKKDFIIIEDRIEDDDNN